MEHAVDVIMDVPTQGPFTSYEIVCDLRHTRLLQHAKDVNSWANAGPGAKRGIHRLLTADKDWDKNYKWPKAFELKKGAKPNYNSVMRDLLVRFKEDGMEDHIRECEWPFEMREIEHSLCEFDKYSRVKNNEGRRPRSLFRPKLDDNNKELEQKWV
jgi:alpha-glutamyl/putrescinyl thymine pyrophosphorylase clade 1